MTIREKVARALHAQTAEIQGKFPIPSYEHDTAGFYADMSTAAINAFLAAAAEPDEETGISWHMRPDEATEEMLFKGMNIEPGQDDWTTFVEIYRAMLADPTAQFELDK